MTGPTAARTAETLVLAVDCSTTSAKAVAVTADGTVLAQAGRPLRTRSPHPSWHEQDAEQWWSATHAALAEVVAALPRPELVGALCFTHQRESFVCLDPAGAPVRPAILWLDGRATEEIAEHGTAQVHELSGKPPDTTPALYKLAWLARHEPAALAAATRVGDVHAYLAWRATGRWATSVGSGDTLGLLDLQRRTWAPALLEVAGVRAEQLPDLVPTGEVMATLRGDVAESLGLPDGIPLVAGIGDGQAAGLALGARRGVAYLNLGTSMVLGTAVEEYAWDPAFRTLAGAEPGTYVLETVLNAATYVATWCREQFGGVPGGRGIAEVEAAAAQIPPGAEGLLTLPYWNAAQTPWWDPCARGAVVGWHGRHTPAHLYRSILEGVAFELRLHLERLEAATGAPVEVIRAVGGGARSALWVQIVSDVTGRPVRVCSAGELSAAGAGQIGHQALGGPTAGAGPEPDGHDVVPDTERTERYTGLAAVQGRLYPALRDVFADLAAVSREIER